MQAWIEKFIVHRNGIILLPGYTYTQWFQDFIVETDCILFPLFKPNLNSFGGFGVENGRKCWVLQLPLRWCGAKF